MSFCRTIGYLGILAPRQIELREGGFTHCGCSACRRGLITRGASDVACEQVDAIVEIASRRWAGETSFRAMGVHAKEILRLLFVALGAALLFACGQPFRTDLFAAAAATDGGAGGDPSSSVEASSDASTSGGGGGGGASSGSSSTSTSTSGGGGGGASSSSTAGAGGAGGAPGVPCTGQTDVRCCDMGIVLPNGSPCMNATAKCCAGICGAIDGCGGGA